MMPNSSADQELFPLSFLSQYGYCPRRCALIALDQVWEENEYTTDGRIQHQRVHSMRTEHHGCDLYLYELNVYSRSLGVNGKCDCVEAYSSPDGVVLPFGDGRFHLYPIEYKHGTIRHEEREYQIQLCAQAMCLEEQFHCTIPAGAIFYVNAHRREEVELTPTLRAQTRQTAEQIHALLSHKFPLPTAEYGPKCKKCSLQSLCLPKLQRSAEHYCQSIWNQVLEEDDL